MYVSAYSYTRLHTTACICVRMLRDVSSYYCMYVCTHVCVHACIICVCMHACVSAYPYNYCNMCLHTTACMYARLYYVRLHAYMCVRIPLQLLPHAEPRLGHFSGVHRAPKSHLHLVTKTLLTKPYYMQNLDSAILQEYIARPLLLGAQFTCFTGTQVQILTLAAAVRRLQVRHARVCARLVARTASRPPLQ